MLGSVVWVLARSYDVPVDASRINPKSSNPRAPARAYNGPRGYVFRLLGGAFIVAAFGAIVLGAVDAAGSVTALDALHSTASGHGADFVVAFRHVYVAACAFVAAALACMVVVEERPLRGPRAVRPPGA